MVIGLGVVATGETTVVGFTEGTWMGIDAEAEIREV
jgi:hypothetical protein